MSKTQSLDRDRHEQIVAEAIRDKRQLVITFSEPDGWRRLKGVFVSGSAEAGQAQVKVFLHGDQASPVLPKPGSTIGATFRLGHKKCMFSVPVRSCEVREKSAYLNLTWPDHMSQLQRRAYERAAPPKGAVIAVRFWIENAVPSGAPEDRDVRHGQLEDISAGGLRLKVANAADLPLDRTYRFVFTPQPGRPAFILSALLRHRERVEKGRASLGFQFVGMETSTEGLRLLDRLARLVGHFQRANVRRSRRTIE